MNIRESILKLWVCVGVVLALSLGAHGLTDDEPTLPELSGNVITVTVYRDKALVTREVVVETDGGETDFLVTELPERIVSSSLYATADGAIVQGVTYFVDETVEALKVPDTPKELLDRVAEIQLSQQINQQMLQLLVQEEQYLQQLQGVSTTLPNMFTATRRDADSDAEIVEFAPDKAVEVFEYIFEKRAAIGAKKIELSTQATQLSRDMQAAQKAIAEFREANPAIDREFDRRALVSLTGAENGKVAVKLHYLVQNVSWSPTYTAHATTGSETIQLDYNAFVFQQTGEDWTNVHLTLSTASPDMWAEPPVLKPLWVNLTDDVPSTGNDKGWSSSGCNVVVGIYDSSRLREELKSTMVSRQNMQNAAPTSERPDSPDALDGIGKMDGRNYAQVVVRKQVAQYDYSINDLANRIQAWDIIVGDDTGTPLMLPNGQETISLEYELAGTASIPSRPEQMMVKVDEIQLSGQVTYVAVPLLTSQVFREAELENTSTVALLPGPINSYLDEKFVGSGDLANLVSQGEEFALGFGVDSQLEAHRRLVDREERENWGKTRLTCEYEISLTNYKDVPVTVLVKDRLPNVEDTDIKMTAFNSSEPLLTDAYFVQYLKPLGMLRWSVDIPASAERADVKTLTYDYTLEFDKEKHIALPTAVEMNKRERDAIMSEPAMMMNRNW